MLAAFVLLGLSTLTAATPRCRVFPGDPEWPSQGEWDALNKTVSGRLVATVPIGQPCHYPHYDAAECQRVQQNWHYPELHDDSSSSIMAPVWTNRSCDPFTSADTPCTLGNYVRYAIDASSPAHIAAGLRFATKHNVRFVVRNTGHDYLGKSTGAGALAVWTHRLKDITFIPSYSGDHKWRGAALRLGAGVQGFEAYDAAHANGVQVVGGECSTVGIAGGYLQGGGHSALNSRYGLAVDQVLEWKVVTADGQLRTATPIKNKDLYWALSGGGGGTYGVVTEVTIKAHPDTVTTVAKISWSHDGSIEQVQRWWDAVKFYHTLTPGYTDRGAVSIDVLFTGTFLLSPWFGAGLTKAESEEILAPLIAKLQELNLPHTVNITEYTGYHSAFSNGFDPIKVGIAQYGGRLIPRSLVLEQPQKLVDTLRQIIDAGSLIFAVTTHPTLEIAGFPDNSVLPAWRDNQLNLVVTIPWNDTANPNDIIADQKKITNEWGAALRELSPGSGTYMNEADPFEPDFKTAFFGANYDRLLWIKDKYDPNQIFYATTAVGSDRWVVAEGGRLCRRE